MANPHFSIMLGGKARPENRHGDEGGAELSQGGRSERESYQVSSAGELSGTERTGMLFSQSSSDLSKEGDSDAKRGKT